MASAGSAAAVKFGSGAAKFICRLCRSAGDDELFTNDQRRPGSERAGEVGITLTGRPARAAASRSTEMSRLWVGNRGSAAETRHADGGETEAEKVNGA